MPFNKKISTKNKTNAENFVKLGDRLYTPQKFLENAKMKRVNYHLKLKGTDNILFKL